MSRTTLSLTPAPLWRRLGAFTLDFGLILGLSMGSVELKNHWPKTTQLEGLWLFVFIFLIYFFSMQLIWNGTLGKKLFSLQVVSLHNSERLSALEVFKREVLAKFITLFSGWGLIHFAFSDDHKSLGDRTAKSTVIWDLDPMNESSAATGFLKGLGLSLIAGALSLGALTYFIFYTAYPLQDLIEDLSPLGLEVKNFQGCLARGISFDSAKYGSEQLRVEIGATEISYQDLFRMIFHREISVQTFHVAKTNLYFQTPGLAQGLAEFLIGDLPSQSLGGLLEKLRHFHQVVTIQHLMIENVQIGFDKDPPLKLPHLEMKDYHQKSNEITASELWLEGDPGLARLTEIKLSEDILSFGSGEFLLKPSLRPDWIKSDWDVQAFNVREKLKEEVFSGHLIALRGAVDVLGDSSKVRVVLKNFQPHWYFSNAPPIYNLNLNLEGSLSDSFKTATGNGSFTSENKLFSVPKFKDESGHFLPSESLIENRKVSVWLEWKEGVKNPLSLHFQSDSPFPLPEILSQMLYNKRLQGLSPTEAQSLVREYNRLQKEGLAFSSTPETKLRLPATTTAPH